MKYTTLIKPIILIAFSASIISYVRIYTVNDNGQQAPRVYLHSNVDTVVVNDTVIPAMLGESISYGMDTTISPCDDFYQYVNGKWRSEAIVPKKSDRQYHMVSFFDDAHRRMRKRMDFLLDSARNIRTTTENHTLRVLGEFYESCLVADSLERFPFKRQSTSLFPGGGSREEVKEHKDSSRIEQCLQRTLGRLGGAAGQAFIQDLQNSGAVSRMEAMLVELRHQVVNKIKDHPLLDEDEKKYALERLNKLILRVGVPEQQVDYSGLRLSDSDYEHNKREIASFNNFQWVSSIGSNIREKWKASLLIPNAFYMPRDHAIEIPPIMFSPPFFYANGDDASNYSGVGFVIGHEIYHSMAQQLPQIKNPRMKDQIDSFKDFNSSLGELDGWKTNGKRTFNEDIADLGGIKVAYAAWKSATETTGMNRDSIIDGFTPDQRFFIGVGLIWRSKWIGAPPNRDVHAPHFARVNAVAMQMPQFATAFGCKIGDPMVLPPERHSQIF